MKKDLEKRYKLPELLLFIFLFFDKIIFIFFENINKINLTLLDTCTIIKIFQIIYLNVFYNLLFPILYFFKIIST